MNRRPTFARWELVLRDAGNRAGVAADALPQVDNHDPAAIRGWLLESAKQLDAHPFEDIDLVFRARQRRRRSGRLRRLRRAPGIGLDGEDLVRGDRRQRSSSKRALYEASPRESLVARARRVLVHLPPPTGDGVWQVRGGALRNAATFPYAHSRGQGQSARSRHAGWLGHGTQATGGELGATVASRGGGHRRNGLAERGDAPSGRADGAQGECELMADPTGFEPAISSVTGWHVGPLHHGSAASAEDNSTGCPCQKPVRA